MIIKRYEKNGYLVLKVNEDLGVWSDISELKNVVSQYLEKGVKYIAVSFTLNSFLNSESIAVWVQCVELIRAQGGRLGIIRPNKQIMEIFDIMGIRDEVNEFSSEEQLAVPPGS